MTVAAPAILFIQRDGALLSGKTPPATLAQIELLPGVLPALAELGTRGYRCVLLGQTDGPVPDGAALAWLEALCRAQGVPWLAGFHGPLPQTGTPRPIVELLAGFVQEYSYDRQRSAVVGDDTLQPIADFLGLPRLPVTAPGGWAEIAGQLREQPRRARVRRRTAETDIVVEVDLDREGPQRIHTGLGFFDHMLEQIGKHGGFALDVQCQGDLHIDEHHTVEDCALALGSALDQALGERRGIGRFGFLLPMDETRAQIAIDLGGRPYSVFRADFPRDRVGELSTEMVPHFFRSLAETLRANIHVEVSGENTHHMVEASFKGVGRALRQAIARQGTELPSTKGLL